MYQHKIGNIYNIEKLSIIKKECLALEMTEEEKYIIQIETDKDFKNKFNNLLNDNNIKELNKEINKFNPFRILRLENYEIRHSNFLAWLLNPNASH